MHLLVRRLVAPQLERRERTNRDVVPVRIAKRELHCSRIRAQMRLLFEPGDESARPFQRRIEIVHAEEQEQPVARRRLVAARQRRMLVRAPLVKAEQDSSVRIEDLTKVGMVRSCLGLAEERLVPFEATRHIVYADDRPRAFHDMSATKCLGVLLPRVSDFVPCGLRADPDVVDDLERVTSVGNGTCRHEHFRRIVLTWHRRAADTAEPGVPVGVRLLPRCDELLAPDPPELVVRNQNHRDPITPREPATDRAVAHEDTRKIRVDLELNPAAIAFSCGHPIHLCDSKLTLTLAGERFLRL